MQTLLETWFKNNLKQAKNRKPVKTESWKPVETESCPEGFPQGKKPVKTMET